MNSPRVWYARVTHMTFTSVTLIPMIFKFWRSKCKLNSVFSELCREEKLSILASFSNIKIWLVAMLEWRLWDWRVGHWTVESCLDVWETLRMCLMPLSRKEAAWSELSEIFCYLFTRFVFRLMKSLSFLLHLICRLFISCLTSLLWPLLLYFLLDVQSKGDVRAWAGLISRAVISMIDSMRNWFRLM